MMPLWISQFTYTVCLWTVEGTRRDHANCTEMQTGIVGARTSGVFAVRQQWEMSRGGRRDSKMTVVKKLVIYGKLLFICEDDARPATINHKQLILSKLVYKYIAQK